MEAKTELSLRLVTGIGETVTIYSSRTGYAQIYPEYISLSSRRIYSSRAGYAQKRDSDESLFTVVPTGIGNCGAIIVRVKRDKNPGASPIGTKKRPG